MKEGKIVYEDQSSYDLFNVTYYPGMVEISIEDTWHEREPLIFNLSIQQWRTINKAVESTHNGESNDS